MPSARASRPTRRRGAAWCCCLRAGCAAGAAADAARVRGMVCLLAGSRRRGRSGVRVELVELLLALLERGVTPVVPSRGSVGSSGDLGPLAPLARVLGGEGEATYEGERMPGADALAKAGLEPVELTAKE